MKIGISNQIYSKNYTYNSKTNNNIPSEQPKIVKDEVILRNREKIDEGQLEEFVDEVTTLKGVFDGMSIGERRNLSIEKFLVNLTNIYSEEKAKIESSFTGDKKEKQLENLNKKFDNSINAYIRAFETKPGSSMANLFFSGMSKDGSIKELLALSKDAYNKIGESIKKLGNKAKEYIDSGNKAPTNVEEFKKFSEYISSNSTDEMNNLSLDTLSKFDKIATNMNKDGSSFQDFNTFIDKIDLPQGMKDILKLSSFSKIDLPHKGIWNTSINVDEITKKVNENKEYFESLVYSKTESQKQAESNENENVIKMLDMFNNFNNINKTLFSGLKTDSEKYKDFIQQMKIKVKK